MAEVGGGDISAAIGFTAIENNGLTPGFWLNEFCFCDGKNQHVHSPIKNVIFYSRCPFPFLLIISGRGQPLSVSSIAESLVFVIPLPSR